MTMDTRTTTDALIQLERDYWQAIKDRNAQACADLSADGCLVTGAQGVGSFTKQQMLKMMEQGGGYTLDTYELKDVRARMLRDDMGVVAYTVRQTLTVDGAPTTFEAADTSTWILRNGKWECVVHTESILGDPFGRDKVRKS